MDLKDPCEYALVFGSGNNILAWHIDLKKPIILATRTPSDAYMAHINTITLHKGILYDAGYEGEVRETLSGKIIGLTPNNPSYSPIFGISSYKGRLIALRHIEENENSDARLHYVDSGENIVENFGNDWKKGLMYRPHSLDLKVTNSGKIYVASENIVEIIPKKNRPAKIIKLTDYLSDYVSLASDGKKVYSLHTHNHHTNPDGTEVREVPSNKRVAFWLPEKDWNGKNNQKSYDFSRLFALYGESLIIGTDIYNDDNDFWVVNITPKMNQLKRGSRATPLLLLKKGIQETVVYGKGNPLLVLKRKDLEKIIS